MQDLPYFVYQKKKDGICIVRCYAKGSRIVVPDRIEGLPVTELASYAFAAQMEEEPENPGDFPCICGELLEELELPATIVRIGRYTFYNCWNFWRFSFYSNIAYLGAGTFTGCKKLSVLHVWDGKAEKSCLREILMDLNHTVHVHGEDYSALYPAFFEEAVENTPARIIETHTHGVGIQYRNAFKDTKSDWKEYDRLFEIGKYNMELPEAVYAAVYRLMGGVGLEDTAQNGYEAFLREHIEDAARLFGREEKSDLLCWMAEHFIREKAEMELLIGTVEEDAEFVSRLMDISHRRFLGKKKKGFSI